MNEIFEIGAKEILEQGTETIFPNDINISYQQRNNYSDLYGRPIHKMTIEYKAGDLDKTLKTIQKVVKEYNHEVKDLAQHLKGDTKLQSAYNIWHFLRTNLIFNNDQRGKEEIRTPLRTLHDKKVDCDDYSILTASLLLQMGYSPKDINLEVVAFDDNDKFSHIYINFDNIIIDGVMNRFNKKCKNVTKTKTMPLEIQILSGNTMENNIDFMEYSDIIEMPITSRSIYGLGATIDANNLTKRLMQEKTNLIKRREFLDQPDLMSRELRKVRTLEMLNGVNEQNAIADVMPYVYDVDLKTGNFVYDNAEFGEICTEYLQGLADDDLTDFDDYETFTTIDGFGKIRLFKRKRKKPVREARKAKRKAKRQKFFSKIKTAVKKVGKGIKKAAKKVVKAVIKYNPLTIVARNSFLLLMKFNFFGYATNLYIGSKPYFNVKNLVDEANYKKCRIAFEKVAKTFEKIGGKKQNLINAVNKGYNKKPIFNKKSKIVLTGFGTNDIEIDMTDFESDVQDNFNDIYEIDGFNLADNLGAEPVTTATALTAAGALLASIKKFFKGIKLRKTDKEKAEKPEKKKKRFWDIFKKKDKKTPENEAFESEEEKELFNEKALKYLDESDTPEDDDKKLPAWVLPVSIGGGVILLGTIGYFAFRPKKKR